VRGRLASGCELELAMIAAKDCGPFTKLLLHAGTVPHDICGGGNRLAVGTACTLQEPPAYTVHGRFLKGPQDAATAKQYCLLRRTFGIATASQDWL